MDSSYRRAVRPHAAAERTRCGRSSHLSGNHLRAHVVGRRRCCCFSLSWEAGSATAPSPWTSERKAIARC